MFLKGFYAVLQTMPRVAEYKMEKFLSVLLKLIQTSKNTKPKQKPQ